MRSPACGPADGIHRLLIQDRSFGRRHERDPGRPSGSEASKPGGRTRGRGALLAKGRLKDADLVRARRLQEETGGSLLTLLARLGLVSERDHAETCAEVLDLPLVSAKDAPELPPEAHARCRCGS